MENFTITNEIIEEGSLESILKQYQRERANVLSGSVFREKLAAWVKSSKVHDDLVNRGSAELIIDLASASIAKDIVGEYGRFLSIEDVIVHSSDNTATLVIALTK